MKRVIQYHLTTQHLNNYHNLQQESSRLPCFIWVKHTKALLSNLCRVPGWPVLWLVRRSQLWSPDWLASAVGRVAEDRKPKSFQIPWERKPEAPDPEREKQTENERSSQNPRLNTVNEPPNVDECVLTCIMSGIACICMGVGELSPASLRFWRTRGLRRYSDCSSSNAHTGSGMSEPCTFIRCWARMWLT